MTEWRTTPDSIESVRVIAKLDKSVTAMAISDQGTRLAARSASGSVHVFEISDGKAVELAVLAAGGSGDSRVKSLVFSADGEWLYAGADRVLRAWNLGQPNGPPAIVMRGHHFGFIDVTRDGTRLVSGGGEEVPCLWWLRPDDLLQAARRKTGRELTDDELDRFTISTSNKQ